MGVSRMLPERKRRRVKGIGASQGGVLSERYERRCKGHRRGLATANAPASAASSILSPVQ